MIVFTRPHLIDHSISLCKIFGRSLILVNEEVVLHEYLLLLLALKLLPYIIIKLRINIRLASIA